MVLVTVQFNDINAFFVRTPADIGKITVGRVAGFQINCFLGRRIVDADSHFVAGHSCHRILVRLQCRYAGGGIYLWIIGYHAFVHAVESKQISFRTPESTFRDTKFLTVYTLSAYDAFRFVGDLLRFPVGSRYKQIVVKGISQ